MQFDSFNDAVLLAPIIQFASEIQDGNCFRSVFRFTFLCRYTFTKKAHMVLLFLNNRYVRDVTESLVALFSLNLFKMYAARQTQNAAFTGLKSTARSQQQQSHSVPSFRHFKSLVCQKSCDWSAMLTARRSELNYFSLKVIQKASKPLKDFLCWHTTHN